MWITVATPAFTTVEQFDRLQTYLDHEPEGLEARWVGTTEGRIRIIAVWESKAHADAFLSGTLGPALASAFGPEPMGRPEVVGIDVARSYVRQPVGLRNP
jgi:hypothetical protein